VSAFNKVTQMNAILSNDSNQMKRAKEEFADAFIDI
jgi:hypothetical protein